MALFIFDFFGNQCDWGKVSAKEKVRSPLDSADAGHEIFQHT